MTLTDQTVATLSCQRRTLAWLPAALLDAADSLEAVQWLPPGPRVGTSRPPAGSDTALVRGSGVGQVIQIHQFAIYLHCYRELVCS
jgi:hypothetical protein